MFSFLPGSLCESETISFLSAFLISVLLSALILVSIYPPCSVIHESNWQNYMYSIILLSSAIIVSYVYLCKVI